jgi:aspartyl/asparaginyl-tRNA synthetase|tara:strand:+ start:225 stop:1019 length:795 start_codon:yes stop_codon:yes gene_type:complete
MTQLIEPSKYTPIMTALRSFFLAKGFQEVHTQNRLSILAACEDPETVATYEYAGETWPLPQTGQMWLEYELLKNPSTEGFFCISTSYRQEKHIVEGRHDLIFPMFEFEFKGTVTDLEIMERELINALGISGTVQAKNYVNWCEHFGVDELTHIEEAQMANPCMIKNFPNHTSPFWNMKQNGDGTAAKIDVILAGMETIGSAERSTNKAEMRDTFHTISGGKYASLLHEKFGYDRVEKELKEFLSFDFFPRVGGGIGMTRLLRAM